MTEHSAAKGQGRSLDEFFDMVFCRPLGRSLAQRLARTRLTANHVSAVAGVFGVAAGVLYGMPWPFPSLGALAMLTFMVLDCTDGDLARLKGGGGWRGRMIDGYADAITAFSVHLGMVIAIFRADVPLFDYTLPFWGVFFIGCLAGASHMWNSGVVDRLKQALKEKSIDHDHAKRPSDAQGWFDRLLWWSFQFYVSRVERIDNPMPSDYGLFRRAQWVGPTHHHLLLVVSGLLVGVWPAAYYGYFLFCAVPLNLYLLAVLWHGRRAQSAAVA